MRKGIIVFMLNGMILAAALSSCNMRGNESQIQRVDSLKHVVENMIPAIDSIDWDLADDRAIICTENLKFIQQHYKDTISKEQMIFLSDYRDAMKTFEKLMKLRDSQQKEVEHTLDQLDKLTSDLRENLVPEGKFPNYFNQELQAVNSITHNIAHMKRAFPRASDKFERTNPGVIEIVYELRQSIAKDNK